MCIGPNVTIKPTYKSAELPARQPLGEHPAGRLGIPVMETGKHAEERAADQDPVKMPDHEVAVGELEIEGSDRQHDARQAADQEHREETDRQTASASQTEIRPPYIVASQLKNLIPVGIDINRLAAAK